MEIQIFHPKILLARLQLLSYLGMIDAQNLPLKLANAFLMHILTKEFFTEL